MIETFALVDEIADTLGERDPMPLQQIRRIVATIGPDRAQAFVEQTLEVEANGGMLLPDGSRRRTLGGTFFYLVREQVSESERLAIFGPRRRPKKPNANGEGQQPKGISRFWLDLANGKPFDAKRWDREVAKRRNAALNASLSPERGSTL